MASQYAYRPQTVPRPPGIPPPLGRVPRPPGIISPSGPVPRPYGIPSPGPVPRQTVIPHPARPVPQPTVIPHPARPVPRPTWTPHHPDVEPLQVRTPELEPFSFWRFLCIVLVLLLSIILVSNYDPLEGIIDTKFAEKRASAGNATLAVEKEMAQREREMMAHERVLWEKAREARVPQGAFWDVVWPAWDCRAYGKREYWGSLRNIPEGWDPIDACMNMPVEIKGIKIRRPYRCAKVAVFPEVQVQGYWMVDWDQPDCKPLLRDFVDRGCTGYGSGKRRIEAQIVGINDKGGQDWELLCKTTPLVWDMTTYPRPAYCEPGFWWKKFAVWEVHDETCRSWIPLSPSLRAAVDPRMD